ncbi:hypothetical protein LFT45_19035 [Arthrobacter sp. FW305-BF8]|uniref:hypothetical protein n=1 Tax=Arthrobacter sp. FW305-BF8 TaxID=2879617 RepID=UPI001F3445BD|nr:hypothetical protein [Arthrobacter sp. FW305-BF8]UKA53779.1 hypothetical protein LFT45_19035 [Arthrobacter sp. FW305-BF8]
MKTLLLLCIPVVAFAALNVWNQAVAEPTPLKEPGVVVAEASTSASAEFTAGNETIHGGPDGR